MAWQTSETDMKYDSRLSELQNNRLRSGYHHSLPYVPYETVSAAEKSWLMGFNKILTKLEEQYLPVLDAKFLELTARVADPSDWLADFNLEYVLTFYLREDDLEYEEDDDNILMRILSMHFIREHHEQKWGFGYTHENYADHASFLDEQHCYTYHQLYDHFDLGWSEFFRIGVVDFEMKIDEQAAWLPVAPIQR